MISPPEIHTDQKIIIQSESPQVQIAINRPERLAKNDSRLAYTSCKHRDPEREHEYQRGSGDNVLEPILKDIGGDRARAALTDFRTMC